jgi:hypothetical protein
VVSKDRQESMQINRELWTVRAGGLVIQGRKMDGGGSVGLPKANKGAGEESRNLAGGINILASLCHAMPIRVQGQWVAFVGGRR